MSVNDKSVDAETPVEEVEVPTEDLTFSTEAVQKLLKKGLAEPDKRPHLNVVFIGHVDAGKSTTCGNLLYITGQVDARTIEKYEREAKEKNRESWYFAYVMDVNEEERAKGKTVEVGRATLDTDKIRYTILDAPGHKGFVPEMLSGASQADVGVLIISARKGEFEAGFDRGGQTREHALLARTLGVSSLIVAVTKMDESSVNWDQERYESICTKIQPFLKSCGYTGKDVSFVPISGITSANLKDHVSNSNAPCYDARASWYPLEKPTLIDILMNVEPPKRDELGALRIPVLTGFRDSGVCAVGKVESGVAMVDQPAMLLPQKIPVRITGVRCGEVDVCYAKPGENVELKLSGVEEDQVKKGSILSAIKSPVPIASLIEVQMVVVELLEHRPLLTAGYKCGTSTHDVCTSTVFLMECLLLQFFTVIL